MFDPQRTVADLLDLRTRPEGQADGPRLAAVGSGRSVVFFIGTQFNPAGTSPDPIAHVTATYSIPTM